ncbi:hypothetical protein KKB44_03310 [Candidatus Micrarchaeota archaeon]|nr:hypothetical protein [Candidatus Micrarchaeota archaeon]
MKKFIILGILLLASVGFAKPLFEDDYMNNKYGNIYCWYNSADNLLATAQGYYSTPPQSLQDKRDALSDAMDDLTTYGESGDREGFDAQVHTIMTLVFDAYRTFKDEARYAFSQGWETRDDIRNDYMFSRMFLSMCFSPPD